MERLTVPAECLPNGAKRIQIIDARKVKEHAMELYWRLKEYEDTGMMPNDVTDLLAKSPTWIPIAEQTPDYGVPMLVATLSGIVVQGSIYRNPFSNTGYSVSNGRAAYSDASHWMPLPVPPKE